MLSIWLGILENEVCGNLGHSGRMPLNLIQATDNVTLGIGIVDFKIGVVEYLPPSLLEVRSHEFDGVELTACRWSEEQL